VVHAFNPNTYEAEAGRSLNLKSGLHEESLSQKKKQKKKKQKKKQPEAPPLPLPTVISGTLTTPPDPQTAISTF
jgi:hypothetical protein